MAIGERHIERNESPNCNAFLERDEFPNCNADSETRCRFGNAMRVGNATRVLERDAARHVATNALPPAESREHTPWGQSLAQGDQTVVRQVLDGVGAVLVAELVGNCIGHVGMVLVGYYDRLIASPHLGC